MSIVLHPPQLIMLMLVAFGSFNAALKFGQSKKHDTYNWIDVFFGPALMLGLLYWGGFFS